VGNESTVGFEEFEAAWAADSLDFMVIRDVLRIVARRKE
jgi:hypothetical protein